jgi:hypothetical protein
MPATQLEYENVLGIKLTEYESKWSKEDLSLRDWIASSQSEEIVGLLDILKCRWNNDTCTDKFFTTVNSRYPNNLTKLDLRFSATIIVNELREYSGRTFFTSTPYEKSLTTVHKRIGKHFKKSVPEVATVASREEAITMLMLGEAVEKLSTEELRSALSGIDLGSDLTAEKLKPMILQTIGAGGAAALVRLLGKNVIKKAVMAIVEKYIQRKVGEKATKELIKRVGKQVTAQAFKRAMFWVGIALLVKDAWDLTGEATRVTTPLVSGIAIGRTLSRLSDSSI